MSLATEILADAPRRFYKMGEASGNLADTGSDNVALTPTGGPVYGAAGGIPSAPAETAVSHDGVDDAWRDRSAPAGAPPNGSNGVAVFTHMCVFNLDAAAGSGVWWWTLASSANNTPIFGFETADANGRLAFWYRNASGSNATFSEPLSGGSPINRRNGWHLLHVVSDGTTITMYVDGTAVASGAAATYASTGSTAVPFDSITTSGLYRAAHGQWSKVKLQYAAFYDTALSPARVAAHYAAYLASGPTPVVSARQAPYDQRASVITTRAVSYDQRTGIIASRTVAYDQRGSIIAARIVLYDQRQAIVAARQIRYDQRGQLVAARLILFNQGSVAPSLPSLLLQGAA